MTVNDGKGVEGSGHGLFLSYGPILWLGDREQSQAI
jgi:hypothetical protein